MRPVGCLRCANGLWAMAKIHPTGPHSGEARIPRLGSFQQLLVLPHGMSRCFVSATIGAGQIRHGRTFGGLAFPNSVTKETRSARNTMISPAALRNLQG